MFSFEWPYFSIYIYINENKYRDFISDSRHSNAYKKNTMDGNVTKRGKSAQKWA
jgi:hypothetical protein